MTVSKLDEMSDDNQFEPANKTESSEEEKIKVYSHSLRKFFY